MRVIHTEVLLDQRTLVFAFAVDRCEQVLGVDLVLDLLVAICCDAVKTKYMR